MWCLANKIHLSKEKWQPYFVAVWIETWRLFWLLSNYNEAATVQNTQENFSNRAAVSTPFAQACTTHISSEI